MRRFLLLIILVSLVLITYFNFWNKKDNQVEENLYSACEHGYLKINDRTDLSPLQKIKLWQQNKVCRYPGYYDFFLAHFMKLNNEIDNARKIYIRLLEDNAINLQIRQSSVIKIMQLSKDVEECEPFMKFAIKNFPNWSGSYESYGNCLLTSQYPKFNEVILNMEKANRLQPSMIAYSSLVLSYYQVGEYKKALLTLENGSKLHTNMFFYADVMVSAISSALRLDNIKKADVLLTKWKDSNPEAVNNEYYIKARAYVDEQLAK